MSIDRSPASADIRPSPTLAAAEDTVYDLGTVRYENCKVDTRWTIEDIGKWPEWEVEVKSDSFRDSNSNKWCMVLVKGGFGWNLLFRLLSSRNEATVRANVKASVVSSKGKKSEVYPSQAVCLHSRGDTERRNVDRFVKEDDGVLKFLGEVSTPCVVTQPDLQRPRRSVTDDLAALLESGQLSDVKLRADAAEFQAHRAVLCARSPVFSAMLRHDTQEARDGIVYIKDVEADVLREVLQFIYTDSTPLLEKMVDRLLMAADKYDLLQLKELCEVELAKNLTVDNAVATAVIALSHSSGVLKSAVTSFVKRHRLAILDSKGWEEALRNDPDIAFEIRSWK
ncbi:speckle-type POZ protein-like [Schistocerca americana]|uniref:speckle-type POZ protein-like n=1 Tax=Schistocerca americana TaxID=7009 RepID=UPI001F4FA577|nr:speckle-type POZ protein-like [Schistocerca americana]